MGLFNKQKPTIASNVVPIGSLTQAQAQLAVTVLDSISDGVVIVDSNGLVKMINPAAVRMTGGNSSDDAIGVSYATIIRLETTEGAVLQDNQNPFVIAMVNNVSWEARNFVLVNIHGQKIPVSISVTPSGNHLADRIITFRNITQELQRESEQTEFISTASHEMRTPVASIEGYLGLALNPATATIDDRARQYLTSAHEASQHLGHLFQDLLDVTKLDDGRIKVNLVPTNISEVVQRIAVDHQTHFAEKQIQFSFGVDNNAHYEISDSSYAMVDVDFLKEILDNLLENAIKYTPNGGNVWAGVRVDGDNVLINVTDSGIGIPPDSLTHIFQKFYRVDNSQTREIGGTGLGLYIVKKRVEDMNGKVWAESSFSQGSTFYVSLPRITKEEYERQLMIIRNKQMMTPKAPDGSFTMGQAAANLPTLEEQAILEAAKQQQTIQDSQNPPSISAY